MKEFTPLDWMDEISVGLEFRKKFGKERCWGDMEKLMDHEFLQMDEEGNPGPNIIMTNCDSLLASLNVNNPYITVKPAKSAFVDRATVVETFANQLMRKIQLQQEVDACSVGAYLWGRGFIKIGYDSEFGFDPRFDTGLDVPMGMTLSQFDMRKGGDGHLIEYLPTEPGMPWVRAVLPHDIVVPWGCRDLDDAPWIAHRVIRHIDHIKADPKYENKKELKPHVTQEDFTKTYERVLQLYRAGSVETMVMPQALGDRNKKDVEYVELWEIHDRRTRRVQVVAHNHKKFLRDEGNALLINGKLPFGSLCFMPRARKFWTTPDAYYLKFHQHELTDITLQKAKHRRLMVAKLLVDSDSISEVELEKATSPTVGAVVKVVTGGEPISNKVMMMNNQTPNLLLQQDEEMIRRNAREMLGFSRNQIGEYEQTGRRTATEAQLVQQASDLRLDRRQKAITELYKGVMERVLQLVFRYMTIPKQFEILGDDGSPMWQNMTGPELAGDYDYEVGFSTGGNETLQARRQQALQFYMLASQDPLADPIAVRKYVVQAMNDPRFTQIFSRSLQSGQPTQIPQGSQGQAQFPGLPMGGSSSGQNQTTAGQGV